MGLKIVSLYKEIPEMMVAVEKKKLNRNAFLDMLFDKLKQIDSRTNPNLSTAAVAIISHFLEFENSDSHSLRTSARLIGEYNLENKIESLFSKCSIFSPKDLTVYISISNPRHKHLKKIKGVSGTVPFRNTIILFIWPHLGWHSKVLETFIHELAHIARQNKIKGNFNLLEYIISEGISQSIVLEILGIPNKMRVPSEMKLWNIYKNNLNITNKKKIHKLVFGDGKRIPLLAGYFMGYRIIQNYLSKTGKKAHEILKLPATEILANSDYSKK